MAHSKVEAGTFVISLDFELYWGVRDKRTISEYGTSLRGVQEVIPRLLDVFSRYGVKASFATVGFLFAKDRNELRAFAPTKRPNYIDANLSPYVNDFSEVGFDGYADPYHYALDLIKMVQGQSLHEISTHTFSHFYCLEDGQTKLDFEEDIKSAIAIAKKEDIEIESIVFPRNQFNDNYSDILVKYGIKSFRGNEKVWFQSYQNEEDTGLLKRIFRTANCYINLSGHHCYDLVDLAKNSLPFDIPSSCFLRPYESKLPFLRPLQLRRIKRSMTYAAKNNLMYHIWWHPHNFGSHMKENFEMLEDILEYYQELNSKHGFKSATMKEVAERLIEIKSESI